MQALTATSKALSLSVLAALSQSGNFDVNQSRSVHAKPPTRIQPPVMDVAAEAMGDTADVAKRLGVSSEQVERLAGLRAVHADTWVHAIAVMKAPWSGYVSFEEALRWVSTARGHGRGWTIRFEDGSKLACVRRTDPSALATFTPADAPGASESSLKVIIGGQAMDGAFQVRASSSSAD